MSPHDANARDERRNGPDRLDAGGYRPGLRLTVVEYENAPDRATVFVPGQTGVERVDQWLSADAAAFVPLEERR